MNPTSSRCSFGLKQRIDFQNVIKNMEKDIINKEEFARYSVLKGNEQIFVSKYKLLLPSEEELANEISRQKEIFQLQFQK